MSVIGLTGLLAQGPVVDPREQTRQTVYMMGMLAIMGFMFYFAIWRPQQKKAKDHEALLKALRPGDRIVTSSGIMGVVTSIKDKSVAVRSGDSKLEILKSAVAEIVERAEPSSRT
jgi:preprotein translocase subunit YajC